MPEAPWKPSLTHCDRPSVYVTRPQLSVVGANEEVGEEVGEGVGEEVGELVDWAIAMSGATPPSINKMAELFILF